MGNLLWLIIVVLVILWIAGDLGEDFSQGNTDWAILTFDPSVSKDQRDGIIAALGKIYPVKWAHFDIAKDLPMTWDASADVATAKLDGGKAAEVVLLPMKGMTNDKVVIKNLRYFGAPRNDGFIMAPNKVEGYHLGEKAFEFNGTNGFMITVDISSKDSEPAKDAKAAM